MDGSLTGAGQSGDAGNLLARPIGSQSGHKDAAISRKVTPLEPIEPLRIGTAPLIAQAHVDGQALTYPPLVLHKEALILGSIGRGGGRAHSSRRAEACQEGREPVSLDVRIRIKHVRR